MDIEALFAVVKVFADALGIGEARVSTLIFNDGKRLQSVRAGKDIGARSIAVAMQWLSDNWPTNAVWPAEVPRGIEGAKEFPRPARDIERIASKEGERPGGEPRPTPEPAQ